MTGLLSPLLALMILGSVLHEIGKFQNPRSAEAATSKINNDLGRFFSIYVNLILKKQLVRQASGNGNGCE